MSDSSYCNVCHNHSQYCSCLSQEIEGVELWIRACDFCPSHKVRVVGDEITYLYSQDIWPGYDGAKIVNKDPRRDFEKGGQYYERTISLSKYANKKAKEFPRKSLEIKS